VEHQRSVKAWAAVSLGLPWLLTNDGLMVIDHEPRA
jgi:hypothetical protein